MNIDILSLIDPAFENIKEVCRAQIIQYLDSLPFNEKLEMLIASKPPKIPKTQEEVQQYIEGCIQLYDATMPEEQEELKLELIDICNSFGIVVDPGLPLEKFQLAMRSELERKSNAVLLDIGVFGRELTQEEIEVNKEMVVSGYMLSIQQAGIDQALIQLGKVDLVSSDFNYSIIADKFPMLVSRVKENILNRNLLN
jgi:hypothetical protein